VTVYTFWPFSYFETYCCGAFGGIRNWYKRIAILFGP